MAKTKELSEDLCIVPIATIQSIIKKYKKFHTVENVGKRGLKPKISPRLAQKVCREALNKTNPLLTKRHREDRLAFPRRDRDKDPSFWSCPMGCFICLHPLWGYFSATGPGNLVKLNGIMRKEQHMKILEENIKQSAENIQLGRHWTYQQDNDPTLTTKAVKKYFEDNKVDVLEWPSQSPDLNRIENMWKVLKTKVHAQKPSNLKDLVTYGKEE
uniref:Tc1-like transposase DDE domain-containing protein n=1 Tax=Mola mola TaxID=94237 RepID=A0A3Q3WM64_MOLML